MSIAAGTGGGGAAAAVAAAASSASPSSTAGVLLTPPAGAHARSGGAAATAGDEGGTAAGASSAAAAPSAARSKPPAPTTGGAAAAPAVAAPTLPMGPISEGCALAATAAVSSSSAARRVWAAGTQRARALISSGTRVRSRRCEMATARACGCRAAKLGRRAAVGVCAGVNVHHMPPRSHHASFAASHQFESFKR